MRAGERKTGWTKPLPPSLGLWGLDAPGLLLVGHRGIAGGGLEPFAVPTRLSSGQHSLDPTIWPSRRNADGARGASVPEARDNCPGARTELTVAGGPRVRIHLPPAGESAANRAGVRERAARGRPPASSAVAVIAHHKVPAVSKLHLNIIQRA